MAWMATKKEQTPVSPRAAAPVVVAPSEDLERRAMQIGVELLKTAREHRSGIFSSRFWSDQLMDWAMKDPAFKLQLFRFIDVFPMLHTPAMVHDYLTDYLSQPGVTLPPGMDIGLKAGGLAKGPDGQDHRKPNFLDGRQLPGRHRRHQRGALISISFGAKAWPSASICWAKPASARTKRPSISNAISIWSRSCRAPWPDGSPASFWNPITSARSRARTSRSRSPRSAARPIRSISRDRSRD